MYCSFLTLGPFLFYQFKWRTAEGGCAGVPALTFNAAFNACLLLLFVQFYTAAYKQRSRKAKAQ